MSSSHIGLQCMPTATGSPQDETVSYVLSLKLQSERNHEAIFTATSCHVKVRLAEGRCQQAASLDRN